MRTSSNKKRFVSELDNQLLVRFTCSRCGKRFKVHQRFAGKHIHIPEAEKVPDPVNMNRSQRTALDCSWLLCGESLSKALTCAGSAVLAAMLAIQRAAADNNGTTNGVVVTFLLAWPLLYWSFRWSARRKRRQGMSIT
jgi:hypothetical protein